ncbi:hypothetical protein P280DRAFT_534213 [Massarina eburnea CBS 473.64]|uniref:Uncharacterized protein n=1 Tax=Massarina eburnea CBS 473.64 TaxID=1395130 RepID=A0A6A6RP45_9PLEO|nr:hypothetical protein P280DRAFT_534213 [Massarina eburnea CBS 473.64]
MCKLYRARYACNCPWQEPYDSSNPSYQKQWPFQEFMCDTALAQSHRSGRESYCGDSYCERPYGTIVWKDVQCHRTASGNCPRNPTPLETREYVKYLLYNIPNPQFPLYRHSTPRMAPLRFTPSVPPTGPQSVGNPDTQTSGLAPPVVPTSYRSQGPALSLPHRGLVRAPPPTNPFQSASPSQSLPRLHPSSRRMQGVMESSRRMQGVTEDSRQGPTSSPPRRDFGRAMPPMNPFQPASQNQSPPRLQLSSRRMQGVTDDSPQEQVVPKLTKQQEAHRKHNKSSRGRLEKLQKEWEKNIPPGQPITYCPAKKANLEARKKRDKKYRDKLELRKQGGGSAS